MALPQQDNIKLYLNIGENLLASSWRHGGKKINRQVAKERQEVYCVYFIPMQ